MYKDMLGPLENLTRFEDPTESPKRKENMAKSNEKFESAVKSLSNETGVSICLPIAFFLGIIGAILLLLKKPWAAIGGAVAGWFTVGLMVLSAIMVISKVKKSLSASMGGFGSSLGISIGPTIWYYIAIAFFVLAACLAQRLYQVYKTEEQLRMEEEVMAQYPINTKTTEHETGGA